MELRSEEEARSLRAVLLALALATVASPPLSSFGRLLGSAWWAVAGIFAALFLAGLALRPGRWWLRLTATCGVLAWVAGSLLEHLQRPGRGLAVLLTTVAIVAYLWPQKKSAYTSPRERDVLAEDVLRLAAVALLCCLDQWGGATPDASAGGVAVSAARGLVLVAPLWLLFRRRPEALRPQRWALLWVGVGALVLLDLHLLWTTNKAGGLATYGALLPVALALWAGLRSLAQSSRVRLKPTELGLVDVILGHPARILVLSFLAIGLVGAFVLGLPLATRSGRGLHWLDALFTSISATCVTGLAVVDTPSTFSFFGQLALLALIQIGGLGIMVFSAAAMVWVGERLSLSHERAAVEIVGASGRAGLMHSIKTVFRVTFLTEAAAALLLWIAFWLSGRPLGVALWEGIFTAVSAFCNAGFALHSQSLVAYAQNPFVLGVVALTILIGGLGPPVVAAVYLWRREATSWSLHVRLVLWATAILLVVPAFFFATFEWHGTLAGLSTPDKLVNAFFQSVTLRTAGFNTVELSKLQPATWSLMILAMFIGGSPGSTAGGVKTTTIAVLFLAIAAVVRGRQHVQIFGRTIPNALVMRSTAITALGVFGCLAALWAIQLTQVLPLDVAIFEVVSALATVGLSTGGTAALDGVGKAIIIACMFTGRVGLLTLFVFLSSNRREQVARRYPDEDVPIG